MSKLNGGIGLAIVMVLVALVAAGCEKSITTRSLDITPASAVIPVRGGVSLKASLPVAEQDERQIYYPLEWSVSDGTLGGLHNIAGDSAVYVAGNRAGVNTVIVRDQMGAEGVALITQVVPAD